MGIAQSATAFPQSAPQRQRPKIKLKRVAYFKITKNKPSTDHVSHTNHHNLTTNNHPFAPQNLKTPSKKPLFTAKRISGKNPLSREQMTQENSIERRTFLRGALAAATIPLADLTSPAQTPPIQPQALDDRAYWLQVVKRVSDPVLEAVSKQQLRAKMPVEAATGHVEERRQSTHLEAFARLLSGLAPWLELNETTGEETALQAHYRELARAGIHHGTDPSSPDYMHFGTTPQTIVDTAFLALAIVRSPVELWEKLDKHTRANLAQALRETRQILPYHSNWLLFSAMIEACLCFMGESWDKMRIDYAIQQHEQWYLGDGIYGDGPQFHWDYYNSFVIQPMLLNILDTVKPKSSEWESLRPDILERAQRYAAIQERLISPEATFPPIGRSLAYRFGAFHHLAEISLRKQLPAEVSPEQVRSALTAVMRRMIEAPRTFDANGWLTIGFAGHQPEIAESYISTGSCYLCAAVWLPLGLPQSHTFWAGPAKPWTARKIWDGVDVKADHAL